MRISKNILSLAILVVPMVALAQPASAATRLSGISVQSACTHQYGSSFWASLNGNTVMNWYCIARVPNSVALYVYGVNLSKECKRIYGSTAYAAYTNFYNPYSWGCYR